jgi:tetratricopeptide (TPR) repeat protein
MTATGSSQCRDCHPKFYEKWATSHHGLAMQPFSVGLAAAALKPQPEAVKIGEAAYRVVIEGSAGFVEERGPKGTRRLPMAQVLGGKNAYYFLTPMDRGRLQVLPLGYDVQQQKWYDVAASGVRMHAEGPASQALSWTDPAFTFNTSCYSCHVSQLRSNYDVATDTYHSVWKEPGINCETCHNDGSAHISLYTKDPKAKHENMRILRITKFTTVQRTEMCAPCHAKMSPISASYQVQQKFFDHYDLVTLEDPDYYPDGRDLGENYTYTGWLMSPCARSGKLDCVYCHTSSGRYRFATGNRNGACTGCHQSKAADPQAHTHHQPGTPGGQCVDCHMPKTRFANMNRSDHSMLPPAPAATLKYKSPNGCNLCHKGKDAAWADAKVRQWHKEDYQKPVLRRAALVDSARKGQWEKLPAMLEYLRDPGGDHVTQASLARLLRSSNDPRKMPALLEMLRHADPLIRAAAASSMSGVVTMEIREALVRATGDEYRLVRIRAAAALASVSIEALPAAQQETARKATEELIASYNARPDDFSNQTNLGNFYLDRGQADRALPAYETAIRLRPDSVATLVNTSIAYSRAGRPADAERVLDQALRAAPENAAANFNRGLLLAEAGRKAEAEASLRKALVSDPGLAAAAFNLCVLMSERKDGGGIEYCRQAAKSDPSSDKYAFSLAYYLDQAGQTDAALRGLEPYCARHGGQLETRMLLAGLFAKKGRKKDAAGIYQATISNPELPADQRRFVEAKLRALRVR